MQDVVIVGGGFAGVWSALSAMELIGEAASGQVRVQLINPRDDLVIRPRLYESDPSAMKVPLAPILDSIGVRHIRGMVRSIDTVTKALEVVEGSEIVSVSYDRLILASGSRLVDPPMDRTHLHDVDTVEAAVLLDEHIHNLADEPAQSGRFTAVVVGAGFTGIELAAELIGRVGDVARSAGRAEDVRIVLVERSDVIGPELGPGPRPVITEALLEMGIEVRLGVSLDGFDGMTATLDDGSTIEAGTVVWAANQRASELTTMVPGSLDRLGRLDVDQQLRVRGVASVFAAGDTASPLDEAGHVVTQSCQHAMPQGTFAGHNAVADLLGLPLRDFASGPYRTCLDLGSAGAVLTSGWNRSVQMVGSQAKAVKRRINTEIIYPPVSTAG